MNKKFILLLVCAFNLVTSLRFKAQIVFQEDFGTTSVTPSAENAWGRFPSPYVPMGIMNYVFADPATIDDPKTTPTNNPTNKPDQYHYDERVMAITIENNRYAVLAPKNFDKAVNGTGLTGWSWQNIASINDHSGTETGNAMFVNAGVYRTSFYFRKVDVDFEPDTYYELSYYVNVWNSPIEIIPRIYDANKKNIASGIAITSGNRTWTKITVNFKTPAVLKAVDKKFYVSLENNLNKADGNDFLIDDIVFKKVETPTGPVVDVKEHGQVPTTQDDVLVNNSITILTNDKNSAGSAIANPLDFTINLGGFPGQNELKVPGEGTWTYNEWSGAITFTSGIGFTGVPTPIPYTITEKSNGSTSNTSYISSAALPVVSIDAVNDSYIIPAGGTSIGTILNNDKLDGNPATMNDVVISQISTTNLGVTINPITGGVMVAEGTPSGTYTIVYEIASKKNPNVKDSATITVVVGTAPVNEVVSLCEPYVVESNPPTAVATITYDSIAQVQSTVNGITYGKGVGKQLTSFKTSTAGTRTIRRIETPVTKFYLRRNNEPTQKSSDIIFIESLVKDGVELNISYPSSVDGLFSAGYINAGIDNVFYNAKAISTDSDNLSNIERMDIIFENGYKVIDPKNELILVIERGRNDPINIAVIKSIDGNNMPTSLGSVVTNATSKMYNLFTGNMPFKVLKRDSPTDSYISSVNVNQNIGLSIINYQDLGVAAGEKIYGYVLLPNDYSKNGATALEYQKFPTTTTQVDGGHDLGVVYGVFTACDTYSCYNSEINMTPGIPVNHGITLLNRAGAQNDNWPMVRNSAFTAIESNKKGFVITRMSTLEIEGDLSNPSKITNPQEGMMVFDTTEKCLKLYDGTKWSCFSTPSCP